MLLDYPMRVTKETNLGELAQEFPEAARYLSEEWGLRCVGCFANLFDTLEAGMRLHGYGEGEIERAVSELNRLLGA
jgi:hypothetical protein